MTPARSRLAVLAGVALVLALLYLVGVHWWFTAPMLGMGEEIERLRDEELALRMEIEQRPALEAELARVRAFEAGNPGFLPEASRELASAGLVQRLQQVIASASPNPNACQIVAQTPSDAPSADRFPRVLVQVRLHCGMAEFAGVLHALEGGSPQLFIDNLDLLARRSYLGAGGDAASGMDVSFDLYGYLNAAAEAGPRA